MKQFSSTKQQSGFTLIELVVVIVILGILAATALPKLQSLDTDAKNAVLQGGVAAFKSAAVITYGHNKGTVTFASVSSASSLSVDNVFFSGTCPSPSAYYGTSTAGTPSLSFSIDSSICNN